MCLLSYLRRLYDTRDSQNALIEHDKRCAVPVVREIKESTQEREIDPFKDVTFRKRVYGHEYDSLIGTGAGVTLQIDSGAQHRSWVALSIHPLIIATVTPTPGPDAHVYVSDDNSLWLRVAHRDVSELTQELFSMKAVDIPYRFIRVYFIASGVANEYFLSGIWTEDVE